MNFFDTLGLIKIKPSVVTEGLTSDITAIFDLIDQVFSENGAPEPTITGGVEPAPGRLPNTRHEQGDAIDLRGRDLADEKLRQIATNLGNKLGPDFDVVAEFFPKEPSRDHIHVEFDPKKKKKCP